MTDGFRLAQLAGAYREWLPAPPLRGHVRCLWTSVVPPGATLQVVPDGCVDVIWWGNALRLAGPDTRAIFETAAQDGRFVGARFRPGVAAAWLGISAAEIVNTRLLLEDFWGRDADRIGDQLAAAIDATEAAARLERALVARLPDIAPPDPAIRAIARMAGRDTGDGRPLMRRLVDELEVSERTLRRRAVEAFGYGPKTLERIVRFQRFLHLLDRPPRSRLPELAVDAGFADQPHLTREVRRLGASTPAALFAQFESRPWRRDLSPPYG